MNYIQYMKPGSKFWLNIGDAVKYARYTSTLDGGGAYYVTSQAKEDLRKQGKEDEARQIEKAEAIGTVGGAIAGFTLPYLPTAAKTLKWGFTTPVGILATKKAVGDMLIGTAGSNLLNRLSTKVTGTTIGSNFETTTDKIPYLNIIPGGVRNFLGELLNVGSWVGGAHVANASLKVTNAINRGINNKNEYIKQLRDAIANLQNIKDDIIAFTKKIKDNGAFDISFNGDKPYIQSIYHENILDDYPSTVIEFAIPDEIRLAVNNTTVAQPRTGLTGFFKDVGDYGLLNIMNSNAHNVGGHTIQFNPINPVISFIRGVNNKMLLPKSLHGILGHELQHSVQRLHTIPLASRSNNYYKAVDDKLIKYFGKPTVQDNTSWHQSPKEFDAEVMRWRIQNNNFTPVQEMDSKSYESLKSFLQHRFWSNGQIRHQNPLLENISLFLQMDLLHPKLTLFNNRSLYDVNNTDNAADDVLQYLSNKGYFKAGGLLKKKNKGKFAKVRDYVDYKNNKIK